MEEQRDSETSFWAGYTRFKIEPRNRRQATEQFYVASEGQASYVSKKKKDDGSINERHLTLADRLTFIKAKQKELQSFFDNQAWEFASEDSAPSGRIMTARFLLHWKKNPDGTRRAKARLVTQGFRDPDALGGTLNTNSPTLTRLSRSFILSISQMLNYTPYTGDISTAFLQGRPHGPELVDQAAKGCKVPTWPKA